RSLGWCAGRTALPEPRRPTGVRGIGDDDRGADPLGVGPAGPVIGRRRPRFGGSGASRVSRCLGVVRRRAMRLRFLVPNDIEAQTGGNVYDREVAACLARIGVDVELLPVDVDKLPAVLARASTGICLVDGLLACACPEAVEANPVAVLVHMPLVWNEF